MRRAAGPPGCSIAHARSGAIAKGEFMRRGFKGRERGKWARTASAFTTLFVLGLLTAATFGGASYAFVGSSSVTATDSGTFLSASPSISSDKDDYNPGSTVTLTGHNWAPDESVHIFVNDDIGQTWSYTTDVAADAAGDLSTQFQLPTSFAATYSVTATGATSGTATTSFTDGNVS